MLMLYGLTREQMLRRFVYDPQTGNLSRKRDGRGLGTLSNGYLRVNMGWTSPAYVHRIAWFMSTGEVPDEVDHIDRCRSNNRLLNLRAASRSENCVNQGPRAKAAVLPRGVHLCRDTGRYRAQARHNGAKVHLGRYDTPEAASDAYTAFMQRAFGAFYSG
jgi:hypothetical protein